MVSFWDKNGFITSIKYKFFIARIMEVKTTIYRYRSRGQLIWSKKTFVETSADNQI